MTKASRIAQAIIGQKAKASTLGEASADKRKRTPKRTTKTALAAAYAAGKAAAKRGAALAACSYSDQPRVDEWMRGYEKEMRRRQ